jgi:hypothetical protein
MIQYRNGSETAPVMPQDDDSLRSRFALMDAQARCNDAAQQYTALRRRVIELIRLAVPRGSTVLVVSKGDDELLETPGRRAWHFPRAINGQYAGCYPANEDEAVKHLESLQKQGADFFVVPSTSYWWLDYYGGLTTHLQEEHCIACYQEDVGIIYRLLAPSAQHK